MTTTFTSFTTAQTYTVQSGDTLSSIAAKFGITLSALEAANPQISNPNMIFLGQVLTIPGGIPTPSQTYTVQSGDTLSSIAAKFGITLSALEAANPQISNPNMISPGQVLTIPGGIPTPSGRSSIPVDQVQYTLYAGGGNKDTWIAQACALLGAPYQPYWAKGYETLCLRESSYDPNAVNTTDGNAVGPIVADGHPHDCSRGIAQCIPQTFAAYHAAGTSLSIYDPVANIAASIYYVLDRYAVSLDGANLQANVQQADPTRPPHGY